MSAEWKRRIAISGIVTGVYAAFRWLLPVAVPFLLAWILAEIFYPAVSFVEKRIKVKKTITGMILLLVTIGIVGGILFLGIRELLYQTKGILKQIPAIRIWAGEILDDGCEMLENTVGITAASSKEYVLAKMEIVQDEMTAVVLPGLFGGIWMGARGILFLISGCVVTFISYILLLGEMDGIRKKIREYSWLNGLRRVWDRLKVTTVLYLKAQSIIIVVVSVVCAVGFWIMGSPYFLLFGIVLGVLDAFPIIGTGAFLYPAAVFLLIRGEYFLAVGCVVLDLLTSVLREILEPRLLGKKLGIPSIFVLIAVYAGVFLYGAKGVILGPLSFSAMYELGKEWELWGLEKN